MAAYVFKSMVNVSIASTGSCFLILNLNPSTVSLLFGSRRQKRQGLLSVLGPSLLCQLQRVVNLLPSAPIKYFSNCNFALSYSSSFIERNAYNSNTDMHSQFISYRRLGGHTVKTKKMLFFSKWCFLTWFNRTPSLISE